MNCKICDLPMRGHHQVKVHSWCRRSVDRIKATEDQRSFGRFVGTIAGQIVSQHINNTGERT